MRRIGAVLLFLYAGWQGISFFGTASEFGSGQAFGQLIWAVLAVCGGVYLLKKK